MTAPRTAPLARIQRPTTLIQSLAALTVYANLLELQLRGQQTLPSWAAWQLRTIKAGFQQTLYGRQSRLTDGKQAYGRWQWKGR